MQFVQMENGRLVNAAQIISLDFDRGLNAERGMVWVEIDDEIMQGVVAGEHAQIVIDWAAILLVRRVPIIGLSVLLAQIKLDKTIDDAVSVATSVWGA